MTVHHTGDSFIKSTAKGLEALVSNRTYVVPIHLPDGERKQLRKAMLGWHGYLGQETIVFRSVGARVHGNEFCAALVTLQNNVASSDAGTRAPTCSHPRLSQSGGRSGPKPGLNAAGSLRLGAPLALFVARDSREIRTSDLGCATSQLNEFASVLGHP